MEDLVILTRVFDLLAWLIPKGETFPRVYRHTVTERLLAAALDLAELLLQAQAKRGAARRSELAAADATLNKLRLYLRLAHHWHWISPGQYEHVSRMIAEIGKWLLSCRRHNGAGAAMTLLRFGRPALCRLGGWIRQTAASRNEG